MKTVNLIFGFAMFLLADAGALAAAGEHKPLGAAAEQTVLKPMVKPIRVAIQSEPEFHDSNSLVASMQSERSLSQALGVRVHVSTAKSLREIARASWAGEFDAMWMPANLAVNMIPKGYKSLGTDGRLVRMALLVTPRVARFSDLKGKTLYLPQEDSLAAYVGIAMLSESNVKLSDFAAVHSNGSYQVGLLAIEKGIHDCTVLPEDIAVAWLKSNPGKGRILALSTEVPWQMLIARDTLDPATQVRLATWFSNNSLKGQPLVPAKAEPMKYVARIAHYTPDELPGVTKVSAADAKTLIESGVRVIDVRTAREYEAKHIPGARSIAYTEVSPRVAGGAYLEDAFNLEEIGTKKAIFYCNGPECWKSYKAAKRAAQSKYFDGVYWLRGGLPEWERNGLPVAQQSATSVIAGAQP